MIVLISIYIEWKRLNNRKMVFRSEKVDKKWNIGQSLQSSRNEFRNLMYKLGFIGNKIVHIWDYY